MFNGRFYLGWLLSAMLMYIAFYVFHGLLTNDIVRLTIPTTVFLSVAAVVYLIIALGMSLLFKSTTLKKNIKKPFKRSLLIGKLSALFLYAVAFVVGVSFSYKVTLLNAMVDIGWQLIEQNLGALIVALANTLFYREEEQFTNFM
ncbi:MAG: hypothetical protein ACYDCN_14425 [Bacteroidia bacterium]